MLDAQCQGERRNLSSRIELILVWVKNFSLALTLFIPDGVFNSTGESAAEMVHKSIMTCDITCRRDMYCSVLLCGGSTLIPGFADRLRAELVEGKKGYDHAPSRVRVIDAPERKYHAWIGGSILASLSTLRT
ncbi:actin [Plakobranchus ocellatus]|uniref:Actin n=1 Tax=Plakobranchus ocellatus TaxID=259542 RepID=A0AAV4D3M7_9GAST|nr:actin [Plakobranchus ocellatus]